MLTPKEALVASVFIATAGSNKAIASDLDVTEMAIKNHVKRLMRKFNAGNRVELLMKLKELNNGSWKAESYGC